jgi:hypothetical protein
MKGGRVDFVLDNGASKIRSDLATPKLAHEN